MVIEKRFHFFFLISLVTISGAYSGVSLPKNLVSERENVEKCLLDLKTQKGVNRGTSRNLRQKKKKRCFELAHQLLKHDKTWYSKRLYIEALHSYKRFFKNFYHLLETTYQKYFFESSLEALSPGDLDNAFKSYELITFFLFHKNASLGFQSIFDSLDKDRQTKENAEKVLATFLKTRMWNEAGAFQKKYGVKLLSESTLKLLQNISLDPTDKKPKYYELGQDGAIKIKSISDLKAIKVVGIVDLECGMSNESVDLIENDVILKKFFSERGLLIYSQFPLPDFEKIALWNQTHAPLKINISHEDKAWPQGMIFESTPHFYFLKNGKVCFEKRGWQNIPKVFFKAMKTCQ